MGYWKDNTVTKEQREEMLDRIGGYLFVGMILFALLGGYIVLLIEFTLWTLYFTAIIGGAIAANYFIDKWIKAGK